MLQLHQRTAFTPLYVNELTAEEKKRALESLIFLVEKKMVASKPEHVLMVKSNGFGQRKMMLLVQP